MQIPKTGKVILKPTAIIITDSARAKLFYADNDEFRHLEDISVDTSFKPGIEGHAHSAPGVVAAPTDDSDQMHHEQNNLKHLFSTINQTLIKKLQNKEIEEIILVVPEEHKNELHRALSAEVKKQVSKTIEKNLINHPMDQILAALES